MKKTLSLLLVVALIAGMFTMFAVPTFADATLELPTEYNGKTIDWTVSGKLGTLLGGYYPEVKDAYSALFNMYYEAPNAESSSKYANEAFAAAASDAVSWTAPGGFFEGQGVTWSVDAAAWPQVFAGEAIIAKLSEADKATAADEIAYFWFLADKVDEFTQDLNSRDTWHQGLDVIGFIVADAVQAIKEKAGYWLPDTIGDKTMNWNAMTQTEAKTYYDDWAAAIVAVYAYHDDEAQGVVDYFVNAGLATMPTDDVCVWKIVAAADTYIGKLTAEQKADANIAYLIGYYNFVKAYAETVFADTYAETNFYACYMELDDLVADAFQQVKDAAPLPFELPTELDGVAIDWTNYVNESEVKPGYENYLQVVINLYWGWSELQAGGMQAGTYYVSLGLGTAPATGLDSDAAYEVMVAGQAYIDSLSAAFKADQNVATAIGYFEFICKHVRSIANEVFNTTGAYKCYTQLPGVVKVAVTGIQDAVEPLIAADTAAAEAAKANAAATMNVWNAIRLPMIGEAAKTDGASGQALWEAFVEFNAAVTSEELKSATYYNAIDGTLENLFKAFYTEYHLYKDFETYFNSELAPHEAEFDATEWAELVALINDLYYKEVEEPVVFKKAMPRRDFCFSSDDVATIMAKYNGLTRIGAAYELPTEYAGRTLDWTIYLNRGGKDQALIQEFYRNTLGWGDLGDSQAFFNMLFGWSEADTGYNVTDPDGWWMQNLTIPSTDINSEAPYYVIEAGNAFINGLTDDMRSDANVKYAIGYFNFLAATTKSMACSLYNDQVRLTFDVIDDILRDSITAIKEAVMPMITDYTTANVLKFASAAPALKDSIALNFVVKPEVVDGFGYTDAYVIFTVDGKEVKVTEHTTDSQGRYVFKLPGLAPYQMGSTVTAVPYAKYCGVEFAGKTQTYSVLTYVNSQLKRQTSKTVLSTLLVDLLNYGAATQQFVGSTDALVNANLTADQLAWGTAAVREDLVDSQNTKYAVIDAPTVSWKGAGLLLNEAVAIRLQIEATSLEGLSVVVKDLEGNVQATITDFEPVSGKENRYYVRFNNFAPHQLSEVWTFTVMQNDVAVSNTLSYSVETYVAKNAASSNAALANLVKALMNYGDATAAYAG